MSSLNFPAAPRDIPCCFSRSSPNVTFPPMLSPTPHGTSNGSLPRVRKAAAPRAVETMTCVQVEPSYTGQGPGLVVLSLYP